MGDLGEDHQQVGRALRLGRLVHRDLDVIQLAALGLDVQVDALRFLQREHIAICQLGQHGLGDLDRSGRAGHVMAAQQPLVALKKGGARLIGTGLADAVGHVDGVEVAVRNEPVDIRQAHMVGIDVVLALPAGRRGCRVSCGALIGRRRANDRVLTIRFVPHDGDIDTVCLDLVECGDLRHAFATEPVTGTH